MPKIKTHSGAAKRFSRTASGRFKHRSALRSHILTKKSTTRKRNLRGTRLIHSADQRSVKRMLGKA